MISPVLGPAVIRSCAIVDHDHDYHHVPINKDQINPFQLTKDSTMEDYMEQNEKWAEKQHLHHPHLFELNALGQAPHTLWIGCSDSRYNENCLNVSPGEVFSFQCIANLLNVDASITLSTLEFAINCLKVKKIIVCGHTDCGGVLTSLMRKDLGSSNAHLIKYLSKMDEIRDKHLEELSQVGDVHARSRRLSEINVVEQIQFLKQQQIVIDAVRDRRIEVWGMIYDVSRGRLEVVSS